MPSGTAGVSASISAITNLVLAPSALLIRRSQAHPWLANAISFGVALAAQRTGHGTWGCTPVAFGAYLLMWLGERDRPAEAGAPEEQG